jgi:hypothetical protein
MPVTNVIDAVQQKYAALTTFTGKPAELWFGTAWPRDASGNLITYPVIRFVHDGTDDETDFEYTQIQHWRFTFTVFSQTVQQANTIYDRVMFNGAAPESQSGFRYASSVTLPGGFTFKEFAPDGKVVFKPDDGRATPFGSALATAEWSMRLAAMRTAWE